MPKVQQSGALDKAPDHPAPAPAPNPVAAMPGQADKPTVPDIDFSSLPVEDADELPKRARDGKVNPFAEQADKSYETKKVLKVTVPTVHRERVENLIRSAAAAKGRGSNVRSEEKGAHVTIYFRIKDRSPRKRKPVEAAESSSDSVSSS